jgi:hypothetical protein
LQAFSVWFEVYLLLMEVKRDPRGQGDKGEMSAIVWLLSQGAPVFVPLGHSPHFDLIADVGRGLVRIQVKTSNCFIKGRWDVTLCTRGGNQSWNGLVKCLDPAEYDYLFVHVGDGRRWFIPAGSVGGTSGMRIGGPRYSEYEIEPGEPLSEKAPSLDSGAPWRGSRAVKGTRL